MMERRKAYQAKFADHLLTPAAAADEVPKA